LKLQLASTPSSVRQTLATTTPQNRLSVSVGWLPPVAPPPPDEVENSAGNYGHHSNRPVLTRIPQGVAYANNAWQVFNPYHGIYCIKPASTTGIYLDQIFAAVTVDLGITSPWTRQPVGYIRSDAYYCKKAVSVIGSGYIEVDTGQEHTDRGRNTSGGMKGGVGFNLVVP
jgi:hypothetical protein